jgi:hypothetical protein
MIFNYIIIIKYQIWQINKLIQSLNAIRAIRLFKLN